MYNVEAANEKMENIMIEVIFDAARANEKRESRMVRGFEVTFKPHEFKADEFRAFVSDDGKMVACAVVDKFDC